MNKILQIIILVIFTLFMISASCDQGPVGCTDENACNFDSDAIDDDGTCEYAEENYDCVGNCFNEIDCAGVCGGNTWNDECGECGGDGSSCACLPGDVNGDDSVDVQDVVSIINCILGGDPDDCLESCSVFNGDGTINV